MTKNQIHELFPIGPEVRDSRLFDPISAITGGIGLVGNVVSGFMGKSAANKAADVQKQAADAAADSVIKTTNDVNPQIGEAATKAGGLVSGATGNAADAVLAATGKAGAGVTSATEGANALLDPFTKAGTAAAGTLQAGLAPGGEFNKTPTGQELLANDPGYAFRIQQAALQSNRSAAARGGAVSGAALSDLNNTIQGVASNEIGSAFNRFETSTNDRFQRLFGEQGVGVATGTTHGNNLLNTAKYVGDTGIAGEKTAGDYRVGGAEYVGNAGITSANTQAQNSIAAAGKAGDLRTGGAAAQASGIVGGTNALTSGLTGGVNSVTGALTLNKLLKNPATAGKISVGVGGAR